ADRGRGVEVHGDAPNHIRHGNDQWLITVSSQIAASSSRTRQIEGEALKYTATLQTTYGTVTING
ncbi:hypothetical protein CTI14_70955, partial [Methylobacterium radiotolerans]